MRFWKKGLSLFLAASIVMGTLQPLSMEAHATEVTEEITSEVEENVQEENVQDVEESPSEKLLENVEEQEFKEPVEEETVIEEETLEGKTISILGASISTYEGTSNGTAADISNSTIRNNAKYYPNSTITEVTLNDTWWMQAINDLGLRLLVNNAWSGSSLLYERSGTVGAYVDRCVQLHDDTGENAGEEPDIIAIQMGTNDFQYYKDTLGTSDINYENLIILNDDGTYTYAEPVTSLEAAAIVLHKINIRYPDAEVYYLNISQRVDGTDDLIREFNTELAKVCEHFGTMIVDIYGSAITMEAFDTYIGDGRVHPNKFGMDAYTEAFKRAVIENTEYLVDTHTVNLELDGVNADYGDNKIVVNGDAFNVNLSINAGDSHSVTVTMGDNDITESSYKDGIVTIENVIDDVTITAEARKRESLNFRWEFDGTDLVSVSDENISGNTLTKTNGSTENSVFNKVKYSLEKEVLLLHDRPWAVEWKCEGTFLNTNGSSGARLFTSDNVNANYNARYIFKSNTNGIIAMGEKDTKGSHNYGIALGDYGIDWTALHTCRLENRINEDGTNMIYMYVDGKEIGAMNHYYIGTKDQGKTSNWLNGKDFVFPYIGTDTHGLTNCSIEYLQVWENGRNYESMYMKYDDHMDISAYENVEILDAGEAIIALEENYLVATGIGEAKIRLDDQYITVVVEKAKINIITIMGQSNAGNHFENATSDVTCPLGTAYWWGNGQGVNAAEPVDYIQASKGFHTPLLAELYAQSVAAGEPVKNVMIWQEGITSKNGQSIVKWVASETDTSGTDATATMMKNCLNYYEQHSDKYEIIGNGVYWLQGESDVSMDPDIYQGLFMAMWERLKESGAEYLAFLRVRKGTNLNDEVHEDLDYTGSLAAQLDMVNNNSDMFMATTITENWVGDENTKYSIDISNYITMMEKYGSSETYNDSYGNTATFKDGVLTTTMKTLYGSNNKCHYGKFGYGIIGADAAYNMYTALNADSYQIVKADTTGKADVQIVSKPGDEVSLDITEMKENISFRASCGSLGGTLKICVKSGEEDITEDVVATEVNKFGTVDTDLLKNYDNLTIIVTYIPIKGDAGNVIYNIINNTPKESKVYYWDFTEDLNARNENGEIVNGFDSTALIGNYILEDGKLKARNLQLALRNSINLVETNDWSIEWKLGTVTESTKGFLLCSTEKSEIGTKTIYLSPDRKISISDYSDNKGYRNFYTNDTAFHSNDVFRITNKYDSDAKRSILSLWKNGILVVENFQDNGDINKTDGIPKDMNKYPLSGNFTFDYLGCKGIEFFSVTSELDYIKIITNEAYIGPTIVRQPTDSQVKLGERYCVTVEAEGDGLTYQWYGKDAGATEWFKSSVIDNTYDDIMTAKRAGREVYCVITDAYGNQVTSEVARLVLQKNTSGLYCDQWTRPVILTADTYPTYGGFSSGYYSEGQKFGGIIYSSTFREGSDVLWNLNSSTYYSAVKNPASLLYTVDYRNRVFNESSWAGSVCSTTALKACGYEFPYSSNEVKEGFEEKINHDIDNIEEGDILWVTGHVAGVVDVIWGEDGHVTSAMIVEQAGTVKVFEVTATDWDNYFSENWTTVYRGEQYMEDEFEAPEEYSNNISIIFERGNNTYVSEYKTMLFYIPTATTIYLTKDGVTSEHVTSSFPTKTVNGTTVYDLASLFTGVGDYWFHTEEDTTDICIKVINEGRITVSGTTATLSGYSNCKPHGYRVIKILKEETSNAYNFFDAPEGYTSEYVDFSFRKINENTFEIENIPENTAGWKLEVFYDTGYGWARFFSDNVLNAGEAEHSYENGVCIGCGEEHPKLANYNGKVISILGDSISTFAGYIPTADGFNLEHLTRYPQDNLLTDVYETWWMQIINQLDAKLGINDSWRGATVSGAAPVTTGTTGENASMANLTRIQNLGSNGTPDVILFYGGTNDLAHVSKVGSFDSSTAPTTVDLTTKKWDNLADGYLNTLLRLKHFYPNAQIVCLLPVYTTSYYSNEKLAQGNEVLADICEHYGIAYVDLRDSGITTSDLPDGIHPDAAGMDHITSAVMETLLTDCDMENGEHIVYSVRHELDEVSASKGHYQGISAGEAFEEIITGNNAAVCVTMGGIDITSSAYADGKVSIPKVTGDVVIRAKGEKKPVYDKYLQSISGDICSGTNLWEKLEHDKEYYTANGWAVHSSGKVSSVTIPINPEDHIWATSFQKKGTNGGTIDGIRVTWFGEFDVIESMSADKVYQEFSENGYLTAPEGAVAVNIPVWNNSAENELYILSADHNYTAAVTPPSGRNLGYTTYTCVSCSDEYKENIIDNSYFAGKKLVAIGDSLTNGTGVLANEVYAPLVADYFDMEVVRYGKSGAVLSMGGHLPTRIEVLDMLPKDSDIVTIFLGVNDFTGGVKEGYYGGKLKYDPSATYYELGEFNSEDTTTIFGALRMYCEKIVELKSTETYKNTQFYFITPIILNKNKSISTKIDWSQDKENIHGIKLRDICNAIIETGEYYDIQVIDLNITSGMYYNSENDNSLNVYDGDGIHPGVIGHQMMADAIIKHLKQEYLREDHKHNYSSWITTIYPECTEAGETNRVCSECSKIESKKIEKLGHSFTHYISDGNATRYEDGTKTAKCDRCEVTDTQIEEGSKKVLTGIEVTSFPEKTVYQIRHEDLDVTGGILTLHYENAESEEIPLTLEMISGFNNRVQSEQKLTVTFEGMTTEFTVTVVAEENVVIEKIPNQIYTGKQLKPELEVYDGDMLLVKNKDYTVSYKNNVKAGVATVTIKGKGNYTKTQTAEFVIEPKSLEEEDVLITCADRFHNGKKQKSNPVVKWGKITLRNGTDYTLQFSGDLINAGDVTVTITGKGNYTGERTITYRITEKNISKAILETISTQYYTGEEIKPELVLYADKNAQKAKTPMILGEHYDLKYEKHVAVGKGKVTIVGIGEYGGSRTASFTIKQRNLNSDGVLALFKENVGQDTYSEVYNGTALKPLIEVKDGEKILLENVDYKLSYANNKAAASASGKKKPTVTITGKGNYSGTKKLYFDIAPLDLSKENLEITVADAKYTKKAVKPAVTVKLNGKVLKNGTDYKLSYENNVNVCEKTEETAAYVRIQGIKNYTGEAIKTFRIYEAAVSSFVVDAIPAQDYMPNEDGICPTVVVYANNTEKKLGHALEKDMHYVIKDYQNHKKAGTGKVIIEGIGEYGGTKTVTFKINPRKLSNVAVQLTENEFTYSGQAIKPGVKVYDGEIELKEKVDYTITYSNNVNVPSSNKKLPMIMIKGKGNYTGTLTQTFTITPKDLEKSADITAEAKAVLFNQKTANSKKGITTSITIKDGSKTLKNNKNYKITGYLNNKAIGMAENENPPTVVIQSLGNYTGILEIPYNIYENSISKMSVAKLANEFYTGKEICPKPVVTQKVGKNDPYILEEGRDYTLSWDKNIKIGKAKVIITGKGQYGGSKTVYFTIIPRWMSIIVK